MDGSAGLTGIEDRARLLEGDVLDKLRTLQPASCGLVVSSPPYNIRKSYEKNDCRTYDEYVEWQRVVVTTMSELLTPNACVCWQVGTYIDDGEVFPLDIPFVEIFRDLGFKLRNRIIWRYSFGLNADKRFSGRYETILWFSRSKSYTFNLDPVRVPQIYPGKRHSKSKGAKAGTPSGNPLGKNPSDFWEFAVNESFRDNLIWDIPNVKARHPEHTVHPCQFPVELAERCILALSNVGDTVLDPFIGTGATAIAALKHGRKVVGIDRDRSFLGIAQSRLTQLASGTLPLRPLGMPVHRPSGSERVAKTPDEWLPGAVRSNSNKNGGELAKGEDPEA